MPLMPSIALTATVSRLGVTRIRRVIRRKASREP